MPSKPVLRLAVTGGRKYQDYYNVQRTMRKIAAKFDLVIIHGDCPTGADHWAKIYCDLTETPQEPYPAKWKTQGDAAGFARNQWMVENANIQLCIAFPGGPGTADMVARCSAAGIPVKLIKAREDDCPSRVEKPAVESAAGSVQHVAADPAVAQQAD